MEDKILAQSLMSPAEFCGFWSQIGLRAIPLLATNISKQEKDPCIEVVRAHWKSFRPGLKG